MEMKPVKWTACWQINKAHELKRILASFLAGRMVAVKLQEIRTGGEHLLTMK